MGVGAGALASRSRRIAIIVPVLVRYDAISAAALDTYEALRLLPATEVTLLTQRSDFSDLPVRVVGGLGDLLLEPMFRSADLLIFGFGIYTPLFDAILVGNGQARRVVRFHNITPPDLVAAASRAVIERSFRQLHNCRMADEIWADSEVNAAVLRTHGIDPQRIVVSPLAVAGSVPGRLADKPATAIGVLFVGRMVPAKGVIDAVEAFAALCQAGHPGARMRLVGNLEWSDPGTIAQVRALVRERGLSVAFIGTADDRQIAALYRDAHILAIPSYHEGFCKPVIEALRAGCVPVGYAAHNLRCIADGLARMVPTGDVTALSAAMIAVAAAITAGLGGRADADLPLDRGKLTIGAFDAAAEAHVAAFLPARVAATHRAHAVAHLHHKPKVQMPGIRPEIVVLPDHVAREAGRTSLNRLPDLADWEAGGALSDTMRDLRQPVTIHRKSWEYAMCINGLASLGVVQPQSRALAVGAGSETPLYYYANMVAAMVATDLYDNEWHEGTPLMLRDPAHFAPFPYRQDRLTVHSMPGDALDFPDATFDFVFCLSSIEHFGSRASQAQSLNEMARVLRPGGVACIITELILTEHSDAEYFRWDELQAMFLRHPRLRLVGGAPDLSISQSLVAFPVDLERSGHTNRSPHIVLRRGDMLWTSFSMFLQRTDS